MFIATSKLDTSAALIGAATSSVNVVRKRAISEGGNSRQIYAVAFASRFKPLPTCRALLREEEMRKVMSSDVHTSACFFFIEYHFLNGC